MEHDALGNVVRALEHRFGVRMVGTGDFLVPCEQCKRYRRFDGKTFPHLRVMRLLFCEDCLFKMQLAVVKVGNAPKEIIRP